MLTTIREFRERIGSDPAAFISELQERTGRYGAEEASAWRRSLPKLAGLFQAPGFQPLHLYFSGRGSLALEYQLPAASSWCDVVLLGAHAGRSAAVILELKDWITRGDKPGRAEGLVERQGRQELHPSDQVRGYTEYCRRFHSAVLDHDASVHGCVLFTNDRWTGAYSHSPNDRLFADYPIFSDSPPSRDQAMPSFFAERLTEVDERFASAFATGRYRQQRGFVSQIGAQILSPESRVFELLDNQRVAFSLCEAAIHQALESYNASHPAKRVIVVNGPPGSGKSAIAARLWASLVTDPEVPEGDVVFTTTSMSQNSNWTGLFREASRMRAASGVVRKASSYAPVTTHRVGQLRKRFGDQFLEDASDWRGHLQSLRALGESFRDGAQDNQNLVSIVDEAHALINPEHREGRGQFGFPTTLGPQAFHVIRSSVLSVFLMDPLQGFRQRENTSLEDIRAWSLEAGAGEPEVISLEGAQFRCAGSSEFVTWVEALLGGKGETETSAIARHWRNRRDSPAMEFQVFDHPEPWESALRERAEQGNSVRLVSTYSRRWRTEGAANPHGLAPSLQDFHEPYENGSRHWSRPWNFVRDGKDYTWFVAGAPGSFIEKDPLCEVGCPYVVRGFDFDYIGLLWLDDLKWRDGRWFIDANAVEETGIREITMAARAEAVNGRAGAATQELLERVTQAYRILLTRALKGVYIWIPDDETRHHVAKSAEGA